MTVEVPMLAIVADVAITIWTLVVASRLISAGAGRTLGKHVVCVVVLSWAAAFSHVVVFLLILSSLYLLPDVDFIVASGAYATGAQTILWMLASLVAMKTLDRRKGITRGAAQV